MQEFYYAQIGADKMCYAVTQTAGEIVRPDMISIDAFDESCLGKVWADGAWEDAPAEAP